MENNRVHISALLDLYGPVLSERQRYVLELYYNDDLSLAEIAEDTGITRQGVRDAIKKGEKELSEWELRLGLLAKAERIKERAEEIAAAADKADNAAVSVLARRLLSEI